MLKIVVPGGSFFNELTNEFIDQESVTLELEHSLVSISKWEAIHHKSFLAQKTRTPEEQLDYIKCMVITKDVDDSVFYRFTTENYQEIYKYIEEPMSATYIKKPSNNGRGGDTVTADLIYYWMISFQIPFECQYWHLNRLLTLIQVCEIKNGPKNKMSRNEILRSNAALNAARRKKYNSKG